MIFHENRLLACNIIPYFFRKFGKMLKNLSSAAVVIGALRVKTETVLENHNSGIHIGDAQPKYLYFTKTELCFLSFYSFKTRLNSRPAEKVSMTRKCHNHRLQTNSRYHEEQTQAVTAQLK